MRINPSPVDRGDGGTDYKVQKCEKPCYSLSAEGQSVEQCPFLKIRQGWVEVELHCNDEC
jgi:hypothetical protein